MCKKLFTKLTGIVLILVLFGGCVSSTMMTVYAVDPDGRPVDNATVSVNGKSIGETPHASRKTSNFVGADILLTVSKEGYYTSQTVAAKETKYANIMMAIFLLNPFAYFWVHGPVASQSVVLSPITATE